VSDTRRFRNLCIFYFCLVAPVVAFSGWAQSVYQLRRIATDPVSTSGRVVNDCGENGGRGSVEYSFVVDGVSHQGRDKLDIGVSCRYVKLGQPLVVYYEKGAPENNIAVYPARATGDGARRVFFDGLILTCMVLFLLPIVSAYGQLWRENRPLPRPAFLGRFWTRVTGR
jgi:hypothetical protein